MQWQAPAIILRWTWQRTTERAHTQVGVRSRSCDLPKPQHTAHTQMFYYVYTFIYAALLAHTRTHAHVLIAYNGLFPEFRLVCMKYTKHKHKFKLHIKISTIYTIARNERKIRTGNRQSVAPTTATTKAATAAATQSAQNRRTSSNSESQSNTSNILQFEIYFSFWCHKILMVKM